MKLLALVLLLAGSLHAQTLLVGTSGGEVFNNISLGPEVRAELPFGPIIARDCVVSIGDKCVDPLPHSRFEIDPSFTIYPELKQGYGTGWGSEVRIAGIAWITPNWGASGSFERSGYTLRGLSKSSLYVAAGVAWRAAWLDFPSRFHLEYLQQVHNGIASDGIETNHIIGGHFSIESRLGCGGATCFRVGEDIVAGRVLTQGNPVCDGTLGNGSQVGFLPCPRASTFSGGVSVTVSMEWPRRSGREEEVW